LPQAASASSKTSQAKRRYIAKNLQELD